MALFPKKILLGKRAIKGGQEAGPALIEIRYRTAGQRGKHRVAWLYPDADPAAILSAIHGEPISLIEQAEAPQAEAPQAEAEAPQAAKDADPPPIPDPISIAPTAPAVAATTPIGEVTMKKIGNIEYWLGSPFDPDWETAEPTRSVVWHVTLLDGHTATLRIPENPDYAEATAIARRMMPTMHHIAAPVWARCEVL